MFNEEIKRRDIPPLLPEGIISDGWDTARGKLVAIFADNIYGVTPPSPKTISSEVLKEDGAAFAGKAAHRHVLLSFETPGGMFSFELDMVTPNSKEKLPMIIFLSFHPYRESYETPIEEILDSGYALAIIHYEAVAADNADITSKLAGMYPAMEVKTSGER